MMHKDIVSAAVSGKISLPPVPRVVIALVSMMRDPRVDIADIVDQVEQDPAIAGRVLQLANSPFYAGRRSIASISDAVVALGTQNLQNLILSAGLASVFQQVPGVNLRQFWVDATVSAGLARILAGLAPPLRALGESAYLGGLLHASGHLILCRAFPDLAEAGFEPLVVLRGDALAAAEEQVFGLTHPQIGAAWVDQLNFPTDVGQAIRHYLAPAHREAGPLALLVAAAARLAAAVAEGLPADQALAGIEPEVLQGLQIKPEKVHTGLAQRYEALRQMPAIV